MSGGDHAVISEIRHEYPAESPIHDGDFCKVFPINRRPEVLKIFKGNRDLQDIIGERDILEAIDKHSNVIRLLRSKCKCENRTIKCVMVFEFCNVGTLTSYFLQTRDGMKPLGDEVILSFSQDIANGIKYLHGKNLVHNNLHPGNILLHKTGSKEYPVCKLAGFRCCHHENSPGNYTHSRDFACFAPPEHAQESSSKKSDIFSLGVIIFSLFNRQRDGNTLVAYLNRQTFAEVPDNELTISTLFNFTRNKEMSQSLVLLLKKDPEERPCAEDVTKNLKKQNRKSVLNFIHSLSLFVGAAAFLGFVFSRVAEN